MLLSMAASVIFSLSASADDVVTLKVIDQNGAEKEYALDDVKRLAFHEESFTMFFNGNAASEEFRYEDVLKMQFGAKDYTGLQNVAEDTDFNIKYDGSMLMVEGCGNGANMLIYDISGRPVMNKRINNSAEISTSQLSAGVYILKINNKTFKFSKL